MSTHNIYKKNFYVDILACYLVLLSYMGNECLQSVLFCLPIYFIVSTDLIDNIGSDQTV